MIITASGWRKDTVYKILLVDDEAIVREGIKERIDWDELGLICVGDCENGLEAMEAVEQLQPDIIVTDINMPFVDGLELTRYVVNHSPLTKIIILTGYDDFSYAQQAIKLKVHDFILKPITSAEMRKVLEKVKLEIDDDRQVHGDFDRLKKQLNESLPLLKERFLERLVTSMVPAREREERLRYFKIQLIGKWFMSLIVDVDHFPDGYASWDKELLRFAVFNVIQEVLESEAESTMFRNRDEKIIVILAGEQEQLYDKVQRIAESIRQLIQRYFKFTVTIGIGHGCGSLTELPQAYTSALAAVQYRFLLGTNRVISIMDMEGYRAVNEKKPQDWDHLVISCIKTGTEAELKHTIEKVIEHYRTAFPAIKQCYIHIQKLIIAIIRALNELGLKEEDIFGENMNPITYIYEFQTLEQVETWLFSHCRDAIRKVVENGNDYCNQQVRAAEEYLKQNFADEGLSLNELCKHVHMSTSYFSSVFKSRTGKTFVEYLTAVRMDKAKELLKMTSLKTYEIALQSGYQDPNYFSMLFKKYSGDTPTEYRLKSAADKA
jgi:two-component system response regulator YesN